MRNPQICFEGKLKEKRGRKEKKWWIESIKILEDPYIVTEKRRLYHRKSSSHLTISRKTERRWKEYQRIDFYLSLKDEMPWNIVRSSKPAFPTSPSSFPFAGPRLFREPFVLRSDCRDLRGIPPLFARQ